ncbi:hypothetical protein [Pseudomonas sp. LS-2]|uniref:hypothetical protein n=1 Tax=Pseudomonas sp. LS-2 TaxID=2315859 RepID=UPI000E74FBE7|nr:hypothetical protein [Pseudomonas sp. LS-2]RJX79049.1 hypothetical protein D3M70_16755 [Pseudomonas sp. LS-2]
MRLHSVSNLAFTVTMLAVLVIASMVSGIVGLNGALFDLTENQIMYIYSTSAQVLAGVYGLTLTGYLFFRSDLNREARSDETRAGSIEKLEKRYLWQLTLITALVLGTIALTNVVIALESSENRKLLTVFMNVGQSFFGVAILAISFFVLDVIAPQNVEAASQAIQNEIDPAHNESSVKGSLEELLKNYNEIEDILINQSNRPSIVPYSSTYVKSFNRKPSNIKLAELLLRAEKIREELYQRLVQLIKLRNAIIHGAEPKVSNEMVERSAMVLRDLKDALSVD